MYHSVAMVGGMKFKYTLSVAVLLLVVWWNLFWGHWRVEVVKVQTAPAYREYTRSLGHEVEYEYQVVETTGWLRSPEWIGGPVNLHRYATEEEALRAIQGYYGTPERVVVKSLTKRDLDKNLEKP